MPELPEVEVTRRALAPFVEQRTVESVVVRQPRLRWPLPAQLSTTLAGHTVETLRRRGKYLLWTFSHGTLISHHGRDKFSFQIFENGNGHLIDFPNDTTRIGPELFERLKKLMGEEGWRVEPIMFQ